MVLEFDSAFEDLSSSDEKKVGMRGIAIKGDKWRCQVKVVSKHLLPCTIVHLSETFSTHLSIPDAHTICTYVWLHSHLGADDGSLSCRYPYITA